MLLVPPLLAAGQGRFLDGGKKSLAEILPRGYSITARSVMTSVFNPDCDLDVEIPIWFFSSADDLGEPSEFNVVGPYDKKSFSKKRRRITRVVEGKICNECSEPHLDYWGCCHGKRSKVKEPQKYDVGDLDADPTQLGIHRRRHDKKVSRGNPKIAEYIVHRDAEERRLLDAKDYNGIYELWSRDSSNKALWLDILRYSKLDVYTNDGERTLISPPIALKVRKAIHKMAKRYDRVRAIPIGVDIDMLQRAMNMTKATDNPIYLEVVLNLRFVHDETNKCIKVSPYGLSDVGVFVSIPKEHYWRPEKKSRENRYRMLYRKAVRDYYAKKRNIHVLDRSTRSVVTW